MKKTKIILYVINLILIGIIILSNKGIILDSNRVILKNMDESTQVSDLNKTIETLNNSHTEYANYIQTSKINLATAITNAGVSTSGEDSFETMIDNVSNILSNKTSDATAATGEILSGKTAYVKGSKITGTMTNRGAWTSTPTSSGKVTIPAGYHSGSGYVDTSTVYNKGVTEGKGVIKLIYTGGNSGTVNVKSLFPNNYTTFTVNNFLYKPKSSKLDMYICYPETLKTTYTYSFTKNASYSYNNTTGVLTYNLGSPGGTETNAYIVSSSFTSVEVYIAY